MAGPASDLEQLYRAHAAGVFRRARTLLKSHADAHEVVQELFLKLHERPELLAGATSRVGFLYVATTRACLNRLRDGKNRARLLRERSDVDEHESSRAEGLSALRAALARMPEPLGQLAVYYYFDELTHDEIAPLLGCSRRQVGNLLDRLHAFIQRQESHESAH